MSGRLFFKIYLTLIAALVLVALASAVFVRLGDDRFQRGWAGQRDRFIAEMFPPGAGRPATALVAERLSRAFDADISIFDARGRLLVQIGKPLQPDSHHFDKDGPRHFVTRLPDGRSVAVRLGMPVGPRQGGSLGYLVLIAAVIGLASYPVVRHLTRRLERLRLGVETWGGGALETRVRMGGRDEVAAVAATFNQAADRIERMITAHRALLANASHELRSPLARLRMAIDLYEKSAKDQTRAEIVRNLAELDTLVEEILLASRLDHQDTTPVREEVDLLALAVEEAARNGVSASGDRATVAGDPRLLTRMVRNLIQNAQRHGAPPITVVVSAGAEAVELAVRDHGPGIAQGEGARVFEPFYRPAGRGESAGGWGLGLSLVRQIAEHHGATVHHETPGDGGARFVVRFPTASPRMSG